MLSIVLATWNRAETLRKALEKYCEQEEPAGGWKLILIDNNSPDHTKTVIEEFQNKLPIEYLWEGRQGKSYAVNKGIERVEGDLAVFTDDDILPRPQWIKNYRDLCDNNQEADIFFGAIEPYWMSPPEHWLTADPVVLDATLGTKHQRPAGPVTPTDAVGGNMAVRASLLATGHRLSEHMGPKGSAFNLGDDHEFLYKLEKEGARGWFSENLTVDHVIFPEKIDRDYALDRAQMIGQAWYRMTAPDRPQPPLVFGYPRHALRQIAGALLGAGLASVAGQADQAFSRRWQARYYRGMLLEGKQLYSGRYDG